MFCVVAEPAGKQLVDKGVSDLGRRTQSIEALLVSIRAPELRDLGYRIEAPIESPQERLYELLAADDEESAPIRYRALLRRVRTFQRAVERAERRSRPVDKAADDLCDVTERLLNEVRQPVWGIEWEFDDEDWLRDTALAVERYRHLAATGEDDFIDLRAGLEPQITIADQMLFGLGYLLRSWEDYGDPIDERLRGEVTARCREYLEIRQQEGGPAEHLGPP